MRKQMIAARQALPTEERAEWSRRAQENLIRSPWWEPARTVMLYLPIKGEVETALLVAEARKRWKRIVLPRVERSPKRLALHRWTGEPADLVVGTYNILEPAEHLPRVEHGEIDLVVVPGVAFDRWGNRMGYGGGYYDRTLPLIGAYNKTAAFLGLAYAMQVQMMKPLPWEEHDVQLDGIITQSGVITCGRARGPH
ncbi:MAG: 5-formyltetrahydrofolate cyclo-ligase [Bacillota bacterium]